MAEPSRRGFLIACLAAAAAFAAGWRRAVARPLQGLGQFAGGPPPCKPDEKATPTAPQGPDFRAKSPERSSFAEPGLAGTRLVLTGTVSGLTCGPIKRALVDFWQADARGVYDKSGYRLRGHQFTDGTGQYRLQTIVPGPHDARAPHLHVSVQAPGTARFTTQLFFPDEPRNAADPICRSELVMKVTDGRDGKSAAFDIVLNL